MHYLDNSATTPLCEQAKNAIISSLDCFGNPSSLHLLGAESLIRLDKARAVIARSLSAQPSEIYFTSGGSEGNNMAVLGAAYARKREGKRIITTAVEHHSVLRAMQRLEKDGFEVVYLKPESNGAVTARQVAEALTPDTVLVSIMYVNNETGAIMPVSDIRKAISAAGSKAVFHCDCVQAYGKIPVSPRSTGADIITVSGHKVHAPKGIGAVYIKNGCRVLPLINGGEQEKGMRAGTEATVLIDGFGAAVSAMPPLKSELARITELRDGAVKKLRAIGGVTVNSPDSALPYIINFSVSGIRSEVMMHWLESRGIYVSSGSACAKGEPSHVLAAMGTDRAAADSAIRAGMSHFTEQEDLDALAEAVAEGIQKLRHIG